jgi:fibronectin-binding autotransporter adhesin
MNRQSVRLSFVLGLSTFLLGDAFPVLQPAAADSFDWRNVGGSNWNSPVKGQFGGTCWDFSSCATLEAKYKLTRNDFSFDANASEQHICWETNPDMGGTGGGWGPSVLNYFTSHGVVSETECPYQPSSPDVGIAPYWQLATGWESRVWKSVSNWNNITTDTNATKQYLKTYGPLEVGCASWNDLYTSVSDLENNYRGPVGGEDHEVSLVAYYDDPKVASGGYWVIKNSWGYSNTNLTDYGNNGYYLIPYGDIEIHNDTSAITGAVYYSGPMYHTGAWDATGHDYAGTAVTNTWKGTTSAVWNTNSATAANWSNNLTGQSFTWVNQELQAVFDSTGANKAITVSGKVIAHGLTVSAAGYSFAPADGNSSLTITAGGITTSEDVTFGAPVFIGGPQSWNAAAGKTLTVSGALHTVISDLTFSGAGNTNITGSIDGGGAINTYGGAKPGGLIQSGTGVVTISGATGFHGDITSQTGSGGLNFSPPSGASATFDGAFFGGGTVNINCSGTFTLGGGASNFSGALNMLQPGTLQFAPAAGVTSVFSGKITSGGNVVQNGPGTTVLGYNTNAYAGTTTIKQGALQANSGVGLPALSLLILDGGVLQSNGTSSVTFSRSLGSAPGNFQWTANGGGFSAGSRGLTVKVNNDAATPLAWGTDGTAQIVGTLKFGSTTSANVVTFQNNVDLGGADRTIQVDDNTSSIGDYAVMSGNISGTGGIVKAGAGLLRIGGANSYTGGTTISGGVLQPTASSSVPATTFIALDGGVWQPAYTTSFTRSLGASGGNSFQWNANGGGFSAGGTSLTVNIFGDGRTLVWGTNVGSQIVGPLKLNSASAAGSLTFVNGIDLNGGARTIVADGKTVDLSGAISDGLGGGSLTKTGVATLYLDGAVGNTYTGPTTILGGDVYLNKASGYAIPGDLILGGSTSQYVNVVGANQIAPTAKWTWIPTGGYHEIKLLGHSQTVTGISDATGTGVIENTWNETGYAAVTLTINNSADCSFNGYVRNQAYSGNTPLALVKTGTGTQTLVGGNIGYSGGTTVSQGKLVLRDITNANFLTYGIRNDAALELSASSSDFNYSGAISGGGSLIITGGHKLTLSGSSDNTYAGATTVSGGNVTLAKTAGYAFPGNFTITDSNGASSFVALGRSNQVPATAVATFNHGSSGYAYFELLGNAQTLAGISNNTGTGVIENTENETDITTGGTLTVNNTTDCSFNGYMRDGNYGGSTGKFALVKDGSGTLTLAGANVCGYTGGLTVKSGTLNYSGATANLPTGGYVISGGTLHINSRTSPIAALQITGGAVSGLGTLTSASAYDVQAGTIAVSLAGTGIALNKTTGGTAILAGTDSYSGTTTIAAGTLQLGTGGATGSLTNSSIVINAGAAFDVNRSGSLTLNNAISGAGSFIKDGTAWLTLSACTSSGDLVVNSGILAYSGTSTLPAGTYTVNGGTLSLGSRTQSIAALRIAGGTVSGGTLTGNADYDVRGGTIAATLAGATIGLNKTGPDTAIVAVNCSLGGLTTVSAGTFQLGTGSTTGSVAGNISIDTAGTLNFYRLNNVTFADKLSGTGTLMKTGTGTLTMTGANSFSGNVIVGGGTLDYSGNAALPVGSYAVSAGTLNVGALSQSIAGLQIIGGTLAGTGTLASATTLDVQGGVIDAVLAGTVGLTKTGSGASLLENDNAYTGPTLISDGVLALSELGQVSHSPTIDNRATFLVTAGEHTVNDIVGTGATMVDLDSTLTAASIIQDSLVIGGDHSDLLTSASAGVAWAPSPVPEPSSLLLLSCGLALACTACFRNRRRK